MSNYWLEKQIGSFQESCFPKPDYNDLFDDWFEDVRLIAEKHGATLLMKEPWEGYFENGYSPANAFSSKMDDCL